MRKVTICMPALCLCLFWISQSIEAANTNETRPYEFSFNIADFQHRFEKQDSAGIVTGEYGFITADGVYHETGYATNKNGDFIITKMKNRKITSLQVAEEIFKGKPEVAKRVIQVLARSCGGCGIPVHKQNEDKADKLQQEVMRSERKMYSPTLDTMTETAVTEAIDILSKDAIEMKNENFKASANRDTILRETAEKKEINNEISDDEIRSAKALQVNNDTIDENIPDDLHYRFNYTITSHDHEETGYRDGKKDGSYRARGVNGTDTKVEYVSNEFGHQPNITFVNRQEAPEGKETLTGFSFDWVFRKR